MALTYQMALQKYGDNDYVTLQFCNTDNTILKYFLFIELQLCPTYQAGS